LIKTIKQQGGNTEYIDLENWDIVGSGKVLESQLIKPTGNDDWDTLFIFNEQLDNGVWEFELLVKNVQNDRSGLVFGFFNGANRDPS